MIPTLTTVTQMTELRAKARAQGVDMRVVKNTLARKAMVGTSFEAFGTHLKGPLVLAFSKNDPGAAARVVKDFAKTNDKLVARLVSLGGQVLPGSDLEKVASLPTREQALSIMACALVFDQPLKCRDAKTVDAAERYAHYRDSAEKGLLKAPIEKFVRTLVAPHTKLVRTVVAIRDAKQATSG